MFRIQKQIRLTELTEADVEELFDYRSNPDVWRYQTWIPGSVADAFSFVRSFGTVSEPRRSGWTQFAIRLVGSGELAGDCGCHMMKDNVAEIGYTIAPAYQGFGYATEAVRQLLDLLARHDVVRVIARTDTRNIPSMKVLVKLGFTPDPNASETCQLRGETVTDACYRRIIEKNNP